MTAAFVLGINMAIGLLFAIAFSVVAATNSTARGARWVAAGYAMGVLDVALEFGLRLQGNPILFFEIGIFLAFLIATSFCLIGVARHYRVPAPWKTMAVVWIAALVAIPFIFTFPYGSAMRTMFYQLPYVVMQSLIGLAILRSERRQLLDRWLMALSFGVASIYLLKPSLVLWLGAANAPQDYMASSYAAVSQTLGSVTLIALALVLLLVMMRDATTEMVSRLETDPLSGVLNRRGFDERGGQLLALARENGAPAALVMADIDHFKAVNDRFGHAVGDLVIAQFAALLKNAAANDAVVVRLGGEEFAVLLLGKGLTEARSYAESVRSLISREPLAALGLDRLVTASFGVAQFAQGDSLFDLSCRADAALYEAKGGGRNQVSIAE
jgi:diguanylate cyclase (GGDEF)-like protein